MIMRFFSATLLATLLFPATAFARIPNDAHFADQWYLEKIGMPAAWDVGIGSSEVIVAVIDAGFDVDHPDLRGNLWRNLHEVPGNGVDDDRNGFIDDVQGWDFVDGDADVRPDASAQSRDAVAHGTAVAGLIAARGNNRNGYAGVLWRARVLPLRALNSQGAGGEAAVAAAVDYAVAQGARVINMSFAGTVAPRQLSAALARAHAAGVVLVAALGNDGVNVDATPMYPACLRGTDEDWVIGVAATDRRDRATGYTNTGGRCVDIAAPGVEIFGLYYEDGTRRFPDLYGGPWSGTSTAAPLVSGAAALLISVYPDLTPDQVRTALKLGVDPIRVRGGGVGVGRLNVARALTIAGQLLTAAADVQ